MPTQGAFDRCFVSLLAGLWVELEAVIAGIGSHRDAAADAQVELRMQALLLELHLLADRCNSARWRALLAPSQIEQVRVAVREIRVRLDPALHEGPSLRMREAIVDAQDYLFDLVHRRCLLLAGDHDGYPAEDHTRRVCEMRPPVDGRGLAVRRNEDLLLSSTA